MSKNPTSDNKQLPYQVPYGYFEHLEGRVISKLEAERSATPGWLPLGLRLGTAALVLLFGWVLWQQLGRDAADELQPSLAAIEAEARMEYLLTYGDPAVLMRWVESSEVDLETDWGLLEAEADDFFETHSSTEIEELIIEL